MKLNEGTIYYYIFLKQISQMELFYMYQTEEDVQCAYAFREALL
jgi:hypothetical protein